MHHNNNSKFVGVGHAVRGGQARKQGASQQTTMVADGSRSNLAGMTDDSETSTSCSESSPKEARPMVRAVKVGEDKCPSAARINADPPIETNDDITGTDPRSNRVNAAIRYPATAVAAALNADPSYKSQNGSFNRSHSSRSFEQRALLAREAANGSSYKNQVPPSDSTKVPADPSGIFLYTKTESRRPFTSDEKGPEYKDQMRTTGKRTPRDPSIIKGGGPPHRHQDEPRRSLDKFPEYKDQMRTTRNRTPRDPSIIMGGDPLHSNRGHPSESDDLDVDMEIAPPLRFGRAQSSRPGAAFIDSRGVSTSQPTRDHFLSQSYLVSATPVKESAAKQKEKIVITATPIQKIRRRRQLIFTALVLVVVAVALSVALPLVPKSDNCCDGSAINDEDTLPLPQKNETDDDVPADSSNSTGDDDGGRGSQPPEPTILPTPEFSTERPLEWIKLGQDTWIRDSEDVTATAVAMSRNGLTFALGATQSSVDQVLVYRYEDAYWKMIAEIVDDEDYSATGRAVALDDTGSILAVGSPWYESMRTEELATQTLLPENSTGLVRVYRISDDETSDTAYTAVQMGSDIMAPELNAEFGWSVDLSSNGAIVAIGARQQCIVRVLQFNELAQEWFDLGQLIVCVEESGEIYDHTFGTSVSLSSEGTRLAIGEPGRYVDEPGLYVDDSESEKMFGRVRVFEFDETTNEWTNMGQAIDGETLDDAFGTSLSLSSDAMMMAVGSPFNNADYDTSQHPDPAIGSCRVFRYDKTRDSWMQLGPDIDGESRSDYFGTAVALSANGNIVAVGATGSNENGDDSGNVRVLEYDAMQNKWNPVGPDIPGPFAFAEAGMSVALSASGDIVTVPSSSSRLHQSAGMATAQVFESGAAPSSVADFHISLEIRWNKTIDDPNEIRWFAERLDVGKRTVAAMEATTSWSEFRDANGIITSNMTLVEGGVYRFVLTVIDLYDEVPTSFLLYRDNGSRVTFFGNETNTMYAEHSFIASSSSDLSTAAPAGNTTTTPEFVTLRIDFDEHPSDVHWVLLARSFVVKDNRMKVEHTVLAFGPKTVYGNELTSSTYSETIDVSLAPSDSTLKLFFTDTGRDGLCCSFGTGSYRIYNGTSFDDSTDALVSGSAEGLYREVKEFTLFK